MLGDNFAEVLTFSKAKLIIRFGVIQESSVANSYKTRMENNTPTKVILTLEFRFSTTVNFYL